ncbi:glutathione S-transferase family protein [Latilactobacillus curvatus]|uniref:glutathione S-transferase N-terminal domain-containing protein n=1 Tax=Latilactobacillus curvatus TaxID=28038 RepID=UPI0024114014|nr:glutathione S-transferase N-terminal domain-containing protein [Latilactobacillus curvatus]MDG2978726.1 glutathione S-transferase family protein [Latilactobacillus curvatus]
MNTLFYASGASSLSVHILFEKSQLPYTLVPVNLDTHTTTLGDYHQLNPKNYVPALQTESGDFMTECAVILEYISHQSPLPLMADYATEQYWQQRMWLNYIATELHKNFISPFRKGNWLPNTPESQELVRSRVFPRFAYVEKALADQSFLVANQFSAPDAYLFVMTNWCRRLAFSLADFPNLDRFDQHMRQDPAVQSVLKQEGKPHSLKV